MKNKNYSICFVAALFLLAVSSCSVNKKIRKADKKYEIGEYHKAASIYKTAYSRVKLSEKQTKGYVAYRLGDCYDKIGATDKAERMLANCVRYKYADTTSYLLYADVLRKQKKNKEAAEMYDVYLKHDPNSLVALNGKLSALKYSEWEKAKRRYEVFKDPFFNSKKSESSPRYPGGDSTIVYFASSRDNKQTAHKVSNITGTPNNDIYFAKKNAVGKWDNLELVDSDINTEDDEGSPAFSSDGKIMLFTRCRYVKGETHGGEIWMSQRQSGKWGKATRVMVLKDSSVTVAHPALSPDGNWLYFVSDMPGGIGGKDIWRCMKTGESYSAAENLGPDINTDKDEMYPFIREDSTLYFSSNGHEGFGGLDIYRAKEDTAKKWVVENMGAPINSNGDDFGISFVAGAEQGAFSSNRGEIKGYDKIYTFVAPPIRYIISGKVKNTDGDALGDANVRIVGTDGTNVKLKTKNDGSYSFEVKPGVEYVMLGNCRGYLNEKNAVNTLGLEDSKTFDIPFTLASVSKPVGLDNIFFEFGKATLTAESSKSLDKLVKLLKDNPNITIEIGAHTDKVGSAEGNLALSGERAQSVVNYLIKGGIEAPRLTAKGYGKTKPVVADKNLAKQYSFLKENDELNEDFIDALSKEDQEIANKINRRTEFRVLKTTYNMY